MSIGWIAAEWPAPANVVAGTTTRVGGVSTGAYESLNLGGHVGDDVAAVNENRGRLRTALELPNEPRWISQVHGADVVIADDSAWAVDGPEADAVLTRNTGQVCAVLTADCVPVLLCAADGSEVAAVHAGWRGIAAGIIGNAVQSMTARPDRLLAWLGPAIGQAAYEVGEDMRAVFKDTSHGRFAPNEAGRWQADLYGLARDALAAAGVQAVYGGGFCTASEPERFFSHRRDGLCGRQASLIFMR